MGGDIWSLQVSCYKSVSFAVTGLYLVSLEMEQNSGFPHLLVADTDRKKKHFTLDLGVCMRKHLTKHCLPLLRARCSESLLFIFSCLRKEEEGKV